MPREELLGAFCLKLVRFTNWINLIMRAVFLFIYFCLFSIVYGQSLHVLYGERNLKSQQPAVYIDKEGSFYPDYLISNSSLDNCNASLINWYAKNQNDFLVISKQYNCSFDKYSLENCNVLNDSIISSRKQALFSNKGTATSVSFLIHGYRKPFLKSNGDRTSPRDYAIMKETFQQKLNTLFVEVYWDAMYDCCYSTNRKKNKALYNLLQEAEKNALPVGLGLRKVFYDLKFDTINIITHSLGAQVALHSLFNSKESISPTPANNRINICLIAPALSDDSFNDYYKRKTDIDFKSKDNYRLMIGYNENDFVLRKKVGWFGPGPYRYVNTTLGCNHKGCSLNFKKYFTKNFINSSVTLFDLSSVGQCHLVGCYCSSGHLDEMIEFLKK